MRPPRPPPSPSPPMNAAVTVLTAAVVCPRWSVSRRVQTISYTSPARPEHAYARSSHRSVVTSGSVAERSHADVAGGFSLTERVRRSGWLDPPYPVAFPQEVWRDCLCGLAADPGDRYPNGIGRAADWSAENVRTPWSLALRDWSRTRVGVRCRTLTS